MPGATNVAWGGATLTVTVSSVDVSCDVVTCSVDRSQNRLWDPVDAGLCQIALDITEDGADIDTGPVGSAVVVNVAYSAVDRNLFTGVVQRRRLIHDPIQGDQLLLDCVDYFERLSRVNIRADDGDSTVGGGESPNNRIARWLNVVDSLSDRALDSSTYTCPATLMDGNVLLQIQAAAFADGGIFFIDGDGVATFYAWAWRTEAGSVAAVFSDRRLHDWVPYSGATLTDDLDEVQNLVAGTRRAIDGEMTPPLQQTVENTTSTAAYGPRGDALDNLELETDEQVADRVTALVTIAGMPSPRFDQIVVQPAFDPVRMWPRVIPCTFGSLVAANRLWEDGTEHAFYGHVIGEQWRFTGTDAAVEWRVSGTGAWDANGPPRPPICVVIDPITGKVKVCDGTPCDDISEVIFKDCDGDPIGDPLPPGSLCGDGVVVPEDACEVCFVNDFGEACIDLQDPRLAAVLWFDMDDAGPDLVMEKIDGDLDVAGFGFLSTTADGGGAGVDAICATSLGGVVGTEHSATVQATDFTGGWRIDWWLDLPPADAGSENVDNHVYLDSIRLALVADTVVPGFEKWELWLIVTESATPHQLTLISDMLTDGWHHYVVSWDPTAGVSLYVDGVLTP